MRKSLIFIAKARIASVGFTVCAMAGDDSAVNDNFEAQQAREAA
jgi:hypothetical protein